MGFISSKMKQQSAPTTPVPPLDPRQTDTTTPTSENSNSCAKKHPDTLEKKPETPPPIAIGISVKIMSKKESEQTAETTLTKEKKLVSKLSFGKGDSMEDMDPLPQKKFDHVIRLSNLLVKPEILVNAAIPSVTRLKLSQALPPIYPLSQILKSLNNIQVLNLSGNSFGPQAFRAVCLAMCSNTTVIFLSLAANKTDTESADCVGKMLLVNRTLEYLDVSSNSLGNDYFSRCVSPALKENTTLKTLRAKSVGSTDMKLLSSTLVENTGLTELDLSSNGLSDKTALAKGLAAALRKPGCLLLSVCVSQCNMNDVGLQDLCTAVTENSSLTELNISSNQLGSLKLVAQFLSAVFNHPKMTAFHLNDAKVNNQTLTVDDIPNSKPVTSSLQELSLNSSCLTNQLFEFLVEHFHGKLLSLKDVDIGNNPDLSISVTDDLVTLTSDESNQSSVERLTYGMNEADGLTKKLSTEKFTNLKYVNLRKAKLNSSTFGQLPLLMSLTQLATINLDGLRMAGTEAVKAICETLPNSHVTALSVGGCSLADADLDPVCQAIRNGAQLHMLKLSANRITDVLITQFVESMLKHKKYPLSVLDLSDNAIGTDGALSLSKLYTTKGHNSELKSLNIGGNSVGKEGLLSLLSVVGKSSPLTTLYLNNQKKNLQENEMEELFIKLAVAIGLTVKKSGEKIESSCSCLPSVADSFLIKLTALGGYPGMLGNMMHCPAILTDKGNSQLLTLSLGDVLDIAATLKGHDSKECILSVDEWNTITGAKKDGEVPTWLQLADHRARAVYAFNLSGNASIQKLESLFDTEADCSVEEVVLMKDPVTRANSGIAWILMSDCLSVDKAIDYYNRGEAKIFGQPFIVSRINIKVDDVKSTELEAKVRQEVEKRMKVRQAEDSAHHELILRNTEESWKRHAYRLAHPAYADGRIW